MSFYEIVDGLPEGKDFCLHCSGYGSSLKDPIGVDTCTVCGGSGLVEKNKKNKGD